jgi:hypothetical protein
VRDVTALAVGDQQQAGLAGGGDHLLERSPARGAETLEAGELRLDRDAGRARGVDERPALLGDRLGIVADGVEAEADLAATLGDERREPVGKGRGQAISRP